MTVELKVTATDAIELFSELRRVLQGDGSAPIAAAVARQNVVAAEAPAAAAEEAAPAAEPVKEKKTRAKKAEAAPAPKHEPKPEPAEVQEQDAQDEADEEEAAETSALSHDSVRGVLGKYRDRFGMEAVQADAPILIAKLFGEGKTKISDIPVDQESLRKAVAGAQEMLDKNPFKREVAL